MKISEYGKHWLLIDETNIDKKEMEKIHLIKLNFVMPSEAKINQVMNSFPNTNRFIIDAGENVKLYNDALKGKKKYYVENTPKVDLVTFMKRNNKVILNIDNVKDFEYEFIMNNPNDVLRNLECVMMNKNEYQDNWEEILSEWPGNVLITR